jgi:hypothetical protein
MAKLAARLGLPEGTDLSQLARQMTSGSGMRGLGDGAQQQRSSGPSAEPAAAAAPQPAAPEGLDFTLDSEIGRGARQQAEAQQMNRRVAVLPARDALLPVQCIASLTAGDTMCAMSDTALHLRLAGRWPSFWQGP